MSTKDLFKKGNKVLTKSQEAKIETDLESTELVRDVVRANNKFHSHIDYSKPENFAFYGSAQKYYEDSFNRVYQTYPYDGSLSEKEKWLHDSSELDLWILDNAYPKTAGHVKLGTNQSIVVKGGPNNQPGITEGEKEELSKQFPIKSGNSNIWDTSIYRNSNLYVDGTLGNTIEFWAKLDASVSNTATVRLVTIKNTAGATFSISFNRSSGYVGMVYTDAGGDGFDDGYVETTFLEETWAHYSFTVVNTASQVKSEFYKNGVLVKAITSGDDIAPISQEGLSLVLNGTLASTDTVDGLYLDEFRFWKRARTAQEIGRHWHTNVNGGTNTDDNKYNTENRKVDLGIYYKFNEGITGDANIDTTVLDYSGRISNGTITNYTTTTRTTTSAFDESGLFEVAEEKDLIIYSSHPDFISSKKTYMDKGLVYDYNNNSSIYHTMPTWIIEEDESSGENAKELTQVMSSYFDSAQIKIKELVNLKDVEYHTLEERMNKPYSLIRKTLESAGMVVPDLFTEASAFEEILSRGEQEKFEEKLQDVKNTIYQNIYNNLSYIYKSKGTEKAFRNLIRCFGIDDELLKINMYSDGSDYLLEDSRRTTAIKKKFVDFNNTNRDQGLVYTKADPSNASSDSYIRGVGLGREPNLSFTFETEVIFPKRVSSDHPSHEPPTNAEEHIAYLGEYTTSYSANDLFDLKAVKENSDASSENVKFVLTMDGQTLETQFFKSVYENSKWNLAVRLVPKKSLSGVVSGGSTTDYRAELYCVRMLADVVEDEQLVTADITEVNARALLAKDKYISIGALHSSGNPESVSLDNDTRVKISSTLFWYDNLTNEEIKAHASDASNFGRLHPSEEAYSHDAEFATIQVPKRDTLAMHWDFSEVSTTDGSGEFIVNDLSQGNELTQTDINKKAILLDGANDHILVSDQDAFSFTDGSTDKPFSMSVWAFVGDISTDNGPFLTKADFSGPSNATEYIFKQANGKLQMFMYDTTKSQSGHSIRSIANATSLTNNTWHHVVMTYDGSDSQNGITLYTDGSETAATKTTTQTVVDGSPVVYENMHNTTVPLIIGATKDGVEPTLNANRVFEDKLADICVFDKELSAAEVTEIYNSNQVKDMTKFSAYDSIISWWKMGDDLDTTGAGNIKDYKGSHHGTLTYGASIVDETTLDTDSVVDGRYGWFTNLVGRQVTGLGKHFTSNDKQIVNREYVHSAKHRPPEVINSEDLIEIRSQDDLTFTKDAQITTHFFAAEKSMYQVISDDMINLFATIVEFNDLIGQPVNRYRMEYKTLEKFRARYFEKVNNVPSLEKYIELYKWIDSSIGLMIQELIPVSSNFSADLRNMVESHVLERNKYWTKFPTMEMSGEPPVGVMRGINELTYNWKEGHAPVAPETTEDDKFLWGDKRVNASDITTGDSDVDDNREILRKVATRTTKGMVQVVRRGSVDVEENKPILRTVAGATYEGRTYANRALSKPYKLNLDITKNVHGGVNYSAKTKDPNAFIRAATRIIPGVGTVGVAATLAANPVTYEEWKKLYTIKRTVNITISDTELGLTNTFDGDTIYPYYGYRDRDAGIDTTAIISGHHNDSYGGDAEIPMQGPFTETWVGGNQHRHVPLLTGLEDTGSANFTAPTSAAGSISSQPARTCITVADNDDFSFTDGSGQDYSAAISLWVKPNSDRTVHILTKVDEWNIHISGSAVFFTIKDGSSFTASVSPAIDASSNEWHHLVINFKASTSVDSSQIEMWVNGTLLDTDTENNVGYHSMDNQSTDLIIGNKTTTLSQGLNGQMRDIAIFNFKDQSSALSAADITELYNDNIAGHPKLSSLVGWWKLHKNVEGYLGRNGTIVTTSPGEITFNTLPPRMNSSVRPEFYLDDSGVLKHPHEVGNSAAARYTRDEVAKRPVNIRNIKTSTTGNSPLGNYARDYEVVQTSGRTQNNSWFVASGSGTPTEIDHPFVVGNEDTEATPGDETTATIDFVGRRKRSADFALPDRGRSEHVIVERFSAPGESLTMTRGYLDRVAEEFSPYSGINNRNLDVRSDYAKRLYTHSGFHEGSQGYESSSPVLPSVHKVNRNAFFRPLETGCTTDYDNAYVSHQIPRSDLQYAFVTASIDYDKYRYYADFTDIGYLEVPDDDSLSFVSTDLSFFCWINPIKLKEEILSLTDPGGWINIVNKIDLANPANGVEYDLRIQNNGGTISLQAIIATDGSNYIQRSCALDTSLLKNWFSVGFSHDYSSSEIKVFVNGQQPSSTYSTIGTHTGMTNGTAPLTIGDRYYIRDAILFSKYVSPTEALELYNTKDVRNLSFYAQTLSYWKLASRKDSVGTNDGTIEVNGKVINNENPPGQCFYSDQPLFSGYYDEIHVQKGNEEYNAPYADFQGGGWRFVRNVEKASVVNQRRTNTYSQLTRNSGDRGVSSYIEPAVVWNKPNIHYVIDENYDTSIRQGSIFSQDAVEFGSNPISYSYSNNLEVFSNEMLTRAVDIDKTDNSGFSEILMEIFKKAELLFSRSVAREIIFPKHKNVGLKKTRTRTKFDTYKFFWKDKMFDRVKCSNATKLGYEMTPEFQKLFNQKYSVDVVDNFHYIQSGSAEESYKVIGDLTYMGEDRMRHMVTRKDVDPLHTGSSTLLYGLEGICEAQATSSDIVPVYSSSEIARNKKAPIPSPQLYHNPYNENYKESEGWINRKPITSGQKVNYNDYDSFSEEVKLAAQNYGLVSEFRISEHMDKYILENGGNFRAKNYDFLTLDGASHDGESHTLSSGTSIKETSTFYSLKKENDSLTITAYPTDASLLSGLRTFVKNNAEGFFGYNPIYTRTNSTFDITNSVNSEVEILASGGENYISINPYQDGVSAAGKFNLSTSDEDWVEIEIDNFTQDGLINEAFPLLTYLNFSPYTYSDVSVDEAYPSPVVFSVWAQPETLSSGETQTSFGLFNFGSGSRSVSLFSKYNFSQGLASYQDLGITLVLSDGSGDPDEGLPGTTLTDSSSVYTFFTPGGSPAELNPNVMNNVVLQIVPPEPTSAASTSYEKNYLVKIYLNGVELHGVHVMELESANWNGRNSGGQSINAYSPCPIGEFEGTSNPWFEEYDVDYAGRLKGMSTSTSLRLGTADYANSRMNISAGSFKFRGLLDEFTIFRGILPSSSIAAIYNNGVPNNVNELIANGQIVGNGLYETTDRAFHMTSFGLISIPMPSTVDNGEFDLGGKYYSNFESITSSGVVPTGWTTNESNETPANGPTVQQSTLGAGNSVFALRGYLDLHSDVDDPPGAHTSHSDDHFRWIQHPQAFETGITVSFKAYQGRTSGDYGLTEEPEQSKGEYLWLQYKVGTGGTWQDAADPLQPGTGGGGTGGIWDLQTTVTRDITDAGVSSSSPIYLRWIAYAETTGDTANRDTWGIDDIEIKETAVTEDEYTAVEAQRIQILAGSTPFVKYTDFEDNYDKPAQQLIEASLPVWHRIGVPNYDKVVTQDQWDEEFFSSYVHTDDINFIEAADAEHDELGLETTKKVRLKVNAIKKLLPYEGFYPQDRTVQLANLFVEKVSPDILHNEKVYKDQAVQAALQHFFAPGILYNSIKAGIACDWATYTNESGMEPSYFGQTIQVFDATGAIETKYLKDAIPYWSNAPQTVNIYSEGADDAARLLDVPPTTSNALSGLFSHSEIDVPDSDLSIKRLVITKAPNKRLPFESLLSPVEYLLDGTDGDRYTPATASVNVERKSNQHFLLNPSYYNSLHVDMTGTPTTSYDKYCSPYFELSGDSVGKKDFRYELAMNNFLSETVKFFIKEEQLSSFSSRPENEFSAMTSGSTYYMDVALRQSQKFSVVNSPGSLGGRYFGPPSAYIKESDSYGFIYPQAGTNNNIEDPAYAPYTPPYFYGESVARVTFTATETKKYTLDEILEQSTVQYENRQAADLFRRKNLINTAVDASGAPSDPFDGDFENSTAWTSKMPLDSSINLFGKTKLSRQEFDAGGNPTAISSSNNTELDTWVIYTKFECPLFNFSDSSQDSDEGTLDALGINTDNVEFLSTGSYDYTSSYLNTQNTERFTTDKRTGSGIWAGYGKQEDGKGVTVSIRESFPQGASATTGSLIEVCGFTPEAKQIGRVADEKEITEAVVMIPFLDKPIRALGSPATVLVDDKNFIKINKLEYREQERKHNINGVIYTNEAGEEIRQTSITNMIEGMKKYNVPPLYDFETFEDQDPFVMYFFEFRHILDREDLSNIWQGVQPKIAKEAMLDSVEIDHEINKHEFFGNMGKLPEGIRWMTFKVKRKAEKSYYKMTQDSRDDSRFKFDFEVGTKEPEYGYNYPYDYFTMLEKVQVEVGSEKDVDPAEQYRRSTGDEE